MVATQTRGAGKMERLEQICMYVDHHYREEMTLQEAADELGLNQEYFCRFFKQSTGSSFMRYVKSGAAQLYLSGSAAHGRSGTGDHGAAWLL